VFIVRERVQWEGVPTEGRCACSCEGVRESVREWVQCEGSPRVRGSVSSLMSLSLSKCFVSFGNYFGAHFGCIGVDSPPADIFRSECEELGPV